jgi:hypothetical protein
MLLHDAQRRATVQPPYLLDAARREVVLQTIIDVCAYQKWELFAVHVRSTHVHTVVEVACLPEEAPRTLRNIPAEL